MSDFKNFSKKATKDNDAAHQVQAIEHTQVNTPPNSSQTTPKPEDAPKPQDSEEPDANNK